MAREDLHVRIDTEIMQPIRRIAADNGISLAAAVSIVLRQGLQEQGSQR